MAEGVVFEPFLPLSDQDHKGGFVPFQFKQRIVGQIAQEGAVKVRSDTQSIRRSIESQHRNAKELGMGSDKAKPMFLEKHSIIDSQMIKINSNIVPSFAN